MGKTRYRLPYKKVSEFKPCCPLCGEVLTGNNSLALPYKCSKHGKLINDMIDPIIFYFVDQP